MMAVICCSIVTGTCRSLVGKGSGGGITPIRLHAKLAQNQMELTTEITICAPASLIWEILVDFDCYAEWNPFIVEIKGPLAVGATLEVRIVPPGTKGITVKPTITAVVPERELSWKGSLPGLFSGLHSFRIEPQKGGCTFVQSEKFTGLFVPLFRRSLDNDTRRGFELMNKALQGRAEAMAGDSANV